MNIILLLFMFGTTWAEFLHNGCPSNFGIHLLLPHETDCDSYYQCSNGQKILMRCAPGTLFDSDVQICDWAVNVKCRSNETGDDPEDESKHIDLLPNGCPSDFNIHLLLPHETDCGKFYTCNFGDKIEMSCFPGTHFNPEIQVCGWPSDVNCILNEKTTIRLTTLEDTTKNELTTTTTQSTIETSLSSEISTSTDNNMTTTVITTIDIISGEDLETTYSSSMTHTTEDFTSDKDIATAEPITTTTINNESTTTKETIVTSDDTTLDFETTQCDGTTLIGTESDCTNEDEFTNKASTTIATTAESTHTICPDDFFGNVAHPEICDVYYMCLGSIEIQLYCPRGEEYDPNIGTCTLISESGCFANKDTTTFRTTSDGENTTPEIEVAVTTEKETVETETTEETTENIYSTTFSAPLTTTVDYTVSVTTTSYTPASDTTTDDNLRPSSTSAIPTTTEENLTSVQTEKTTTATESITFTASTETTTPSTTEETPKTTSEETGTQTTTSEGLSTTEIINSSTLTTEQSTIELVSTTGPTETTTPSTTEETPKTTSEETDTQTTTDEGLSTTEIINSSTLTTEPSTIELVSTTGPTETTTPPICPAGIFGNRPHPDICDSYYMCLGGTHIQLYCPRGEEFDISTEACQPISENGCFANKEQKTTPSIVTEDTTQMITSTIEPSTIELVTTTRPSETSTTEDILKTTSEQPDKETTTDESVSTTKEPTTTELVTTAEPTETTVPPICPIGVFGNRPHPDICDAYYICLGGAHILLSCPRGEEFDVNTQTCEPISDYGCFAQKKQTTTPAATIDDTTTKSEVVVTTERQATESEKTTKEPSTIELETTTGSPETSRPPICPVDFFGKRPHPEICDSYYICLGGTYIHLYCPKGEEFDANLEDCRPISEHGCFAKNAQTTTPAFITDETTTESDDVVTTETQATETTQETSTKGQSTIESVTTTGPTETTTPPICPVGVFGNRPHPDICDSYYMCLGGIHVQLYCPGGEEFDINTEACKTISENGCFAKKLQTTTAPITVDDTWMESDEDTQEYDQEDVDDVPSTTEIVTTTESHDTTAPPICPAGAFGNRPHPTICDSYYICLGDTHIQLTCPGGEEFDINTKACQPISENGCFALQGNTTLSSVTTDGTTTEREIIVTTETDTIETETTKETHQDIDDEPSTTESVTTTGPTESTTPPICPAGIFGNRPHPEICDSYYMCLGGTYIQLSCPGGEEFDTNTEQCQTISDNGCFAKRKPMTTPYTTIETVKQTSRTTLAEATTTPVCPDGVFGNRPHPDMCNSYYMCLGGTDIQLYCPGGEEFDINTESCISISEGGCTIAKDSSK